MKVRTFSPKRLYSARLRAGLTQDDLAYALRQRVRAKTNGRNVGRWESGTTTPNGDMVAVLADTLGVSLDELYDDDGGDDGEPAEPMSLDSYLTRRVSQIVQEALRA